MSASLRRVYALILRYIFLLKRSIPRLFETMYWPTLNILFLGFLNLYLMKRLGASAINFTMILGASVFLEFFLRPGISFLISFLEEIYSRNIGPLYISPVRAHEQLLAYAAIMLFRLAVGLTPALCICAFFFGYNITAVGWWLAPFLLNMILSGSVCGILLISLIIRFGQSAEWFGWMLGWFFIPFMGVYYPVEILPDWMRLISIALPPTYIFENLRNLAAHHGVDGASLAKAFVLNALYLCGALCVFYATLRNARKRGALLNLAE